ncbi:hypothetical protein SBDP1_1210011 [Syntrophobacter sp. SbD1]|nr:hypothetical protein SBDP1_1210011 [Syntrophobacter sp. SbD1]
MGFSTRSGNRNGKKKKLTNLLIDDIPVCSYPAGIVDRTAFTVPPIQSEGIAEVFMLICIMSWGARFPQTSGTRKEKTMAHAEHKNHNAQ